MQGDEPIVMYHFFKKGDEDFYLSQAECVNHRLYKNKWMLTSLITFVKGTVRYRWISIHVLFPVLNFGSLFIVLALKGPLSEQWEQYQLHTIQEASIIGAQSAQEREQPDPRGGEGHRALPQRHPRVRVPRRRVCRD